MILVIISFLCFAVDIHCITFVLYQMLLHDFSLTWIGRVFSGLIFRLSAIQISISITYIYMEIVIHIYFLAGL